MEGELAEEWRSSGFHWGTSFRCEDGTLLEFGGETIWYDAARRLWRSRGLARVTHPDGSIEERGRGVTQKHPPCLAEMREWLDAHGFKIEHANETAHRATYWARWGSA